MLGVEKVADGLKGVLLYEFKRDLRKKTLILIIVFTFLPVLVAVLLKVVGAEVEDERLWALIMGLDIGSSIAGGAVASLGLAGWAWLVAVLYGGDLMASDLREGGLRLIAIRPLGRRGYILGKLLALTIFLSTVFALAGMAAGVSATIVGGWQEGVWLAPILGALIGLGSVPIALIASLFGGLTRSAITGFILGAAASLLTGVVIGLSLSIIIIRDPLSLEAWKRYYELNILASGIIPITAGPALPAILYYLIEFDNKFIPLPLPLVENPEVASSLVEVGLTPLEVLPLYATSTLIGTLILAYLNFKLALRVEV